MGPIAIWIFWLPYYYLWIYTMNVGEGAVTIPPSTGEEIEAVREHVLAEVS